ncbi:MAG: hypothetical protein ACLP5O_18470 [Acidimicrobiales bacterium]
MKPGGLSAGISPASTSLVCWAILSTRASDSGVANFITDSAHPP